MTLPTEVPDVPIKGTDETQADFNTRYHQWYQLADIVRKGQQLSHCSQFMGMAGESFLPTLNRLADAWDEFDIKLGALATALAGSGASNTSGLSEQFFIQILQLILARGATPPVQVPLDFTGDPK